MRKPLDEPEFIRVYRELTGVGEALARSVYMFACCAEDAGWNGEHEPATEARRKPASELENLYERFTQPRPLPHLYSLSPATTGPCA